MKLTHIKIWNNCLASIKQEVTHQSYQTWFDPIKPQKYEAETDTLTVGVPNLFFCEWLEGHYVNLLQRVIHQELGPKGRLAYQLTTKHKSTHKYDTTSLRSVATPQGKAAHLLSTPLNPNYTFDSFVIGDCNQLAQAAAKNVTSNFGQTSFNPLIIYGSIGLGKTHLAQAIVQDIQKNYPEKIVRYITTEKFITQFVQNIRENKTQSFVDAYTHLDLLVIDDIHFLKGKEKTQEICFHIFNELHQNNKQIVITSDTRPSELQGLQERLLSRLKWGLIVDLQKPDLETKIAIIKRKLKNFKKRRISFSDEAIEVIASHINTNIRELEGVLLALIAQQEFTKKSIDPTLIKQVIQNNIGRRQSSKEPTIKQIQKVVASYYNISLEKLKSASRQREIVRARQLIMYYARKFLKNYSLKAIGEALGRKDHTTVSYGFACIRDRIKAERDFKLQVEDIERMIHQESA